LIEECLRRESSLNEINLETKVLEQKLTLTFLKLDSSLRDLSKSVLQLKENCEQVRNNLVISTDYKMILEKNPTIH